MNSVIRHSTVLSLRRLALGGPKGISSEGSWEWKSGTKGTLYRIYFDEKSDIDYMMFLIKQKYNNLIN